MMKRKAQYSKIIFTIVSIILVSLPGCSRNHHESPASGNLLKIGTIHQVKSKNILFDHVLDNFAMVSHPPLFTLGTDGNINGLLCKRYTVSDDFKRWTFYLKENFFWSDGVPVTPEDVKFSIRYIGSHVPSRRWLEKALVNIAVLPGHAIILTFNQPYTQLDIEFTSFPIIPRHIWQRIDKPRFYSGPGKYIGCGPLIIQRIDLNAGFISMKKNPYWKGTPLAIEGVEIHMFQNLDVLSLALERGDIDTYYKYADTFPYTNIQRLEQTGRFSFEQTHTTGLTMLGFNIQREPVRNVEIRQAIAKSIDYDEIRKLITSGYGELPTEGFVPSGMRFYADSPIRKQDLKAAEALLEKAGYRDSDRDGILEDAKGEDLILVLLSTPTHHRLCQLMVQYLSRVGIKADVKIVEAATWISLKESYDYDITITRTTPWGMLMHAGWGTGYFDSRRSGEGVLHTLSDPVFLKLCDAILATREPHKLKDYARSLQRYYASNLPAIALIQTVVATPYNKSFHGWRPDPLFGIFNIANFLNLKRSHEGL